jgi:hypothetical protein
MDELCRFAKLYQYTDRHTFKTAWETWTDTNAIIVQDEITRLNEMGYQGDIIGKMFKSARYYFIKKKGSKTDPKSRRAYLSVTKPLLDAMDSHISEGIQQQRCKPSTAFEHFCDAHVELLRNEVSHLVSQYGISDAELIKDKFKKTYKNRYFLQNRQGR